MVSLVTEIVVRWLAIVREIISMVGRKCQQVDQNRSLDGRSENSSNPTFCLGVARSGHPPKHTPSGGDSHHLLRRTPSGSVVVEVARPDQQQSEYAGHSRNTGADQQHLV
jgi:hypothetical protein